LLHCINDLKTGTVTRNDIYIVIADRGKLRIVYIPEHLFELYRYFFTLGDITPMTLILIYVIEMRVPINFFL